MLIAAFVLVCLVALLIVSAYAFAVVYAIRQRHKLTKEIESIGGTPRQVKLARATGIGCCISVLAVVILSVGIMLFISLMLIKLYNKLSGG